MGHVLVCGSEALASRIAEILPSSDLLLPRSPADLRRQLDTHMPTCALVEHAAISHCRQIRLLDEDIPILTLVESVNPTEVQRAFCCGCDDYCPQTATTELQRKVAALMDSTSSPALQSGRRVLLAHRNDEARAILGRCLRRHGLAVHPATDWRVPSHLAFDLVIVHSSLLSERVLGFLHRRLQTPHGSSPLVVLGHAAELALARASLGPQPLVRCFDLDHDPGSLPAIVSDLLLVPAQTKRRSARVPFSTPVHAEIVGEEQTLWGTTHNLNLDGLYLRLVDPPPPGTPLELELTPPGSAIPIVVEGTAAWSRSYWQGAGYPPGCGVRFAAAALSPELLTVQSGYASLMTGERTSAPGDLPVERF